MYWRWWEKVFFSDKARRYQSQTCRHGYKVLPTMNMHTGQFRFLTFISYNYRSLQVRAQKGGGWTCFKHYVNILLLITLFVGHSRDLIRAIQYWIRLWGLLGINRYLDHASRKHCGNVLCWSTSVLGLKLISCNLIHATLPKLSHSFLAKNNISMYCSFQITKFA